MLQHLRWSRRRLVAATAAATAILVTGTLNVTTQASQAAPGTESPGETAESAYPDAIGLSDAILREMRAQEALYPAVEVLTETEYKLADSGLAGLAFEGDTLVLHWKGTLPDSMSAALTKAQTHGKVEVRPAAYSLLELESQSQRIWAAASTANDINYIAIPGDGRGLTISQLPSMVATAKEKESGGALVRADSAVAAAGVTVPVEFKTENGSAAALACSGACKRTDDTSAWNSGGKMQIKHSQSDPYYDGYCTAGFAVILNGEEYILTAAHCGTELPWGDWFYDGAGELIGKAMNEEDLYRDLLLVNARGWYWMWDGNTTTSNKKTVHVYSAAVGGSWVCQSGATSGTRCGLLTDNNLYSWQKQDDYAGYGTFTVGRQRKACRQDNFTIPAGLPGDSGGPVFGLHNDGVRAMGLTTAASVIQLPSGETVMDGECIYYTNMDSITLSRSTAPYGYWPGVTPYTH